MNLTSSLTEKQVRLLAKNFTFNDLREMEWLDLVNFYVNDVIGLFLFISGMLFNILSFTYFQISKSFRDTSMRHYFSVLSISDSLHLCDWLFQILMDKKVFFLSESRCRIFLFLHISSGHISVWLLVFLSIERYIILQFPFRGKQFYTITNSLIMLCLVITVIIIADIPYLLPNFITKPYTDYDIHLHMCMTNPKFRTYMFINNVIFYSLIPFIILLIFNCLLISLLARQKSQLFNIIQSENAVLNAKREKQFKERTILLMLVTFFLVLTLSPRHIVQMILMFIRYEGVFKITLAKILIIVEMLNFSFNFFFYILCSKTSRNELYLILYYFLYWKWSANSKKYIICNHPNHNPNYSFYSQPQNTMHKHNQTLANNCNNIYSHNKENQTVNEYETTNLNMYNVPKKNSRLKIHCFLLNASRLKVLENRRFSYVPATNKESAVSGFESLNAPSGGSSTLNNPRSLSTHSDAHLNLNSLKKQKQNRLNQINRRLTLDVPIRTNAVNNESSKLSDLVSNSESNIDKNEADKPVYSSSLTPDKNLNQSCSNENMSSKGFCLTSQIFEKKRNLSNLSLEYV